MKGKCFSAALRTVALSVRTRGGRNGARGIMKALAVLVLAAAMAVSAPSLSYAEGVAYGVPLGLIQKAYGATDKLANNKQGYFKTYADAKTGKTLGAKQACKNCILTVEYVNNKARKGNGITLDSLGIAMYARGTNKKSSFALNEASMAVKFSVSAKKAGTDLYIHVLSYGKAGNLKSHTVTKRSGNSLGADVWLSWRYTTSGSAFSSSNNSHSGQSVSIHESDMYVGSSGKAKAHPEIGGKVVIAVSKSKKGVSTKDPRYTLSSVLSCTKGKGDVVTMPSLVPPQLAQPQWNIQF